MKNIYIVALMVLSISCNAEAAITGINGAFKNMSTVTILGSGFGTKISGNAAPIHYENFETGTIGHDVTVDFPWFQKSSNTPSILISNAHPRYAGAKSIESYLRGALEDSNSAGYERISILMKNNVGFATTRKILFSYWQWYDWGTFWQNTGGVNNHAPSDYLQTKNLHLAPALTPTGISDPVDASYLSYVNYVNNLDTTPSYYAYWQVYFVPGSSQVGVRTSGNGNTGDYVNVSNPGGWRQVTLLVDQGTAGNSDGARTIYNSVLSGPIIKNSHVNEPLIAAGQSYLDAFKFGWYRAYTNQGESWLYTDEIYIDNSWARVEIGNSATYDNCTHRELLIPSEWSDGQIKAKVNIGSFSVTDQVYLFVIKEDNSVSAVTGPLTIGASEGGTQDIIAPTTIPSEQSQRSSVSKLIALEPSETATTLYCRVAGLGTCTPATSYTGAVKVGRNRTETMCYASTDTAANAETAKCVSIRKEKRK